VINQPALFFFKQLQIACAMCNKTNKMKRVKVNAYQVALVFKNGVYQRMLKEGTHWLWNKEAYIYDVTKPFIAPIELNILLQDAVLAETLYVVDVKDNEIVLMYENELLKQVLNPGRYLLEKCSAV
jgi:hypothetical protein